MLPILLCVVAAAAGGPPASAADPSAAATLAAPGQAARKRAPDPARLLGRWEMQKEPGRIVELKAGGTGSMDGVPLTWSVDGDRLTITDPGGTDTVGWRVEGDRLVLAGPFDSEIVLLRR